MASPDTPESAKARCGLNISRASFKLDEIQIKFEFDSNGRFLDKQYIVPSRPDDTLPKFLKGKAEYSAHSLVVANSYQLVIDGHLEDVALINRDWYIIHWHLKEAC